MKKIYLKLHDSGWSGLFYLVIAFIAGLIAASALSTALAIVIAVLVFCFLFGLQLVSLHGEWVKKEKDE